MKTTHWEVEKAFMNVVYRGFVLAFFLIIMGGISAVDTASGFLLMLISGGLVIWNVFVFSIHVGHLQKCIILYDKENKDVIQ